MNGDAASPPPLTRPRALRWRLFVLIGAAMAPLVAAALLAGLYFVKDRREEAERAALDVARALGTAVDAELRSTQAVLAGLGTTPQLQQGRLDDFMAMAHQVAQQQGWRSLVVADASGRTIASSSAPPGGPLPAPVETESLTRAMTQRVPVVGPLRAGGRGNVSFAVRVPLQRDGNVTHVLSAVLDPDRIHSVLQRQKVPEGWVVAVFDTDRTRVARTRDNVIGKPSPTLQALIDRSGREGTGVTRTLEGVPSHTGFVRLPASGWLVAVGVSAERVDQSLRAPLGALAGGVLASLVLAAFLTWLYARRITRPIDQLKEAAAALGRGDEVQLGALEIAELEDVGRALAQASRDREQANHARALAEGEREALLLRVTEALKSAEEAGRTKDQFLAVLGHELRNPLAPIATALHIMSLKGDRATEPERQVVQRQLGHMSRLVDDLLDVSRITGRRLTMREEPVQLASVVTLACDAIRPLLGQRTLTLDIEPPAQGLTVRGDEVRLGQVFNNLLGNTMKFTPADGHIDVRIAAQDGRATVTVQDSGFGMSPEVLDHAFDLFYQAPQGQDRARGGLGLGLAIVRSLVEMHGGSVHARSEGPGQGSCLVVTLPLSAADAPAASAAPVAAERATGRVLVVDDNQDAADTAAALLEMSGYEVRTAYDPPTAIETLDAFQADVTVLDIGLPGMSGYELAQALRGRGYAGKLVALTGYGREGDVQRALSAGFDTHLTKPVSPEKLLQVLAAYAPR